MSRALEYILFFLLLLVSIIGMIGGDIIGGGLLIAHSIIIISIFYKYNVGIRSLLLLLCISLPISYINIYGDIIGVRFTLFNLTSLLFVIYMVFKLHKIKYNISGLIALGVFYFFFVALIYSIFVSENIGSAINSALSFLIILSVPYLISVNGIVFNKKLIRKLVFYYVIGVTIVSITLILQVLLFANGIEIGNIHIRVGRFSFGATFSDYSVLSVYIATGVIIAISTKFLKTHEYNNWIFNSCILIMLVGLILTGSRAGLLAIFTTLPFLLVLMFKKKNIPKFKVSLLSIIFCALIIIGFQFARPSVTGESESILFDSSRWEYWKFWAEFYLNNDILSILFGAGLGSDNHVLLSGGEARTPHNLVLDIFLNGGLAHALFFGFVAILSFLISKLSPSFLLAFICAVVGGLASPSIISARFFLFIIVVILGLYFSKIRK